MEPPVPNKDAAVFHDFNATCRKERFFHETTSPVLSFTPLVLNKSGEAGPLEGDHTRRRVSADE